MKNFILKKTVSHENKNRILKGFLQSHNLLLQTIDMQIYSRICLRKFTIFFRNVYNLDQILKIFESELSYKEVKITGGELFSPLPAFGVFTQMNAIILNIHVK